MTDETAPAALETAELDPDLEHRMDELVEEVAAEIEETTPEPVEEDISNEKLMMRLRKKVYDNIEGYSPRDAMLVFIKVAALREAELKVEAKGKSDGTGMAELRDKARRAMETRDTRSPD